MPFAARVGDMTAHGTPLAGSVGSPNVFIGSMPAWRVGDMHICPLVSVSIPHVGGSVSMGSSSVMINSMPAARVGDMIVENGVTNSIIVGSTNVNIG